MRGLVEVRTVKYRIENDAGNISPLPNRQTFDEIQRVQGLQSKVSGDNVQELYRAMAGSFQSRVHPTRGRADSHGARRWSAAASRGAINISI